MSITKWCDDCDDDTDSAKHKLHIENTALRAENDAQAQEIERLTSALTDILNPLGRMQREAAANGCRLNGMAAHLMNDAQYLKEIAKEALAAKGE